MSAAYDYEKTIPQKAEEAYRSRLDELRALAIKGRGSLTARDELLIGRIVSITMRLEKLEERWMKLACMNMDHMPEIGAYRSLVDTLLHALDILDNPDVRLRFTPVQAINPLEFHRAPNLKKEKSHVR